MESTRAFICLPQPLSYSVSTPNMCPFCDNFLAPSHSKRCCAASRAGAAASEDSSALMIFFRSSVAGVDGDLECVAPLTGYAGEVDVLVTLNGMQYAK